MVQAILILGGKKIGANMVQAILILGQKINWGEYGPGDSNPGDCMVQPYKT